MLVFSPWIVKTGLMQCDIDASSPALTRPLGFFLLPILGLIIGSIELRIQKWNEA